MSRYATAAARALCQCNGMAAVAAKDAVAEKVAAEKVAAGAGRVVRRPRLRQRRRRLPRLHRSAGRAVIAAATGRAGVARSPEAGRLIPDKAGKGMCADKIGHPTAMLPAQVLQAVVGRRATASCRVADEISRRPSRAIPVASRATTGATTTRAAIATVPHVIGTAMAASMVATGTATVETRTATVATGTATAEGATVATGTMAGAVMTGGPISGAVAAGWTRASGGANSGAGATIGAMTAGMTGAGIVIVIAPPITCRPIMRLMGGTMAIGGSRSGFF